MSDCTASGSYGIHALLMLIEVAKQMPDNSSIVRRNREGFSSSIALVATGDLAGHLQQALDEWEAGYNYQQEFWGDEVEEDRADA